MPNDVGRNDTSQHRLIAGLHRFDVGLRDLDGRHGVLASRCRADLRLVNTKASCLNYDWYRPTGHRSGRLDSSHPVTGRAALGLVECSLVLAPHIIVCACLASSLNHLGLIAEDSLYDRARLHADIASVLPATTIRYVGSTHRQALSVPLLLLTGFTRNMLALSIIQMVPTATEGRKRRPVMRPIPSACANRSGTSCSRRTPAAFNIAPRPQDGGVAAQARGEDRAGPGAPVRAPCSGRGSRSTGTWTMACASTRCRPC